MKHLTRLFPKLRVQVGEKPSTEAILEKGFDIKLTGEILETIRNNIEVGDYLTIYPATDRETGELNGVNLKLRKANELVTTI